MFIVKVLDSDVNSNIDPSITKQLYWVNEPLYIFVPSASPYLVNTVQIWTFIQVLDIVAQNLTFTWRRIVQGSFWLSTYLRMFSDINSFQIIYLKFGQNPVLCVDITTILSAVGFPIIEITWPSYLYKGYSFSGKSVGIFIFKRPSTLELSGSQGEEKR